MTRTSPDGDMVPEERAGLFVVRVWMEGSRSRHFRGRITYSGDLSRPEHGSLVASDPDDVKAALTSWLDGFIAQARDLEVRRKRQRDA